MGIETICWKLLRFSAAVKIGFGLSSSVGPLFRFCGELSSFRLYGSSLNETPFLIAIGGSPGRFESLYKPGIPLMLPRMLLRRADGLGFLEAEFYDRASSETELDRWA